MARAGTQNYALDLITILAAPAPERGVAAIEQYRVSVEWGFHCPQ